MHEKPPTDFGEEAKPRYIMLLANYRSQNLPIDSGEEAEFLNTPSWLYCQEIRSSGSYLEPCIELRQHEMNLEINRNIDPLDLWKPNRHSAFLYDFCLVLHEVGHILFHLDKLCINACDTLRVNTAASNKRYRRYIGPAKTRDELEAWFFVDEVSQYWKDTLLRPCDTIVIRDYVHKIRKQILRKDINNKNIQTRGFLFRDNLYFL